jgi:hypothetical protein
VSSHSLPPSVEVGCTAPWDAEIRDSVVDRQVPIDPDARTTHGHEEQKSRNISNFAGHSERIPYSYLIMASHSESFPNSCLKGNYSFRLCDD